MAEVKKTKCELKRREYLGEISALCFLHLPSHLSSVPYLLSGTGSEIHIYDLLTGNMIRSFQVFEGIRVHGISSTFICCSDGTCSSKLNFKIAVFGEKRVKLLSLHIEIATNIQDQAHVSIDLILHQLLPKFSHWVLDVCFLEDAISSSSERIHCLAIGCSDNSVCFWDMSRSSLIYEVKSPERCLLYSMRMWGEQIEALHIASGTIFNEIIVWKVVYQNLNSRGKEPVNLNSLDHAVPRLYDQFEGVTVCRLAGHEGSIFNIAWSSDGSKLVSVSDDRSARIWTIHAEKEGLSTSYSLGPVLFGHTARVWDCCIVDSLIITVGEDCTCRVWGVNGIQLKVIKEHIGRGVWRCLYDPGSSLLVTAGFDSAVKVHYLHASEACSSDGSIQVIEESMDQKEIFTRCIPNLSGHVGPMNSKSEYVRCLQFACEDSIYVATNNGFLYYAKLFNTGDVKWTTILQASKEVPIVCMNLLTRGTPDLSSGIEDWVSLGDGKGNLTVVKVVGDVSSPKADLTFTCPAELERQLLGTFWCKSLGRRFVFTADPRGNLKLWRLSEPSSVSHHFVRSSDLCIIAEFISSFSTRIMCLDASFEEEVLVCGDLRGNLVVFPLVKELLLGTSASESRISPSNYFKGAHGISSVCTVLITNFSFGQVNICSTGADGCICYLEYDRDQEKLQFTGMKQVKELSMVQSVFYNSISNDDLTNGNYAVGFASSDFIIWNLIDETKVVQIPCGGWRRPNTYFLGDIPEVKNCFAFVKDEIIYIHRHWVPYSERNIYPQNLHLQFHGREMHSLCFISEYPGLSSNEEQRNFPNACLIATGCEDGTVRLTRYDPDLKNWTASKLLGEHVGGSAVRSICCVTKMNIHVSDSTKVPSGMMLEDGESPFLLISVGAKRVLTAWKQNPGNRKAHSCGADSGSRIESGSRSKVSATMSFQWLSTDMPTRSSTSRENINKTKNMVSVDRLGDKFENDWRYLAVTAFLVKPPDARISVCFIVVACSDATVALRALIIPYQLWFDITLLVPLASPVLSLQHVIIPDCPTFDEKSQIGSQYIVLGGSTDGSITFWDLTTSVDTFMRQVSALQMEDYDCQKRPRTGRGSQGGRWWRSLGSNIAKKKPSDSSGSEGPIAQSERGPSNALYQSSTACPQRSDIPISEDVDPASLGSELSTENSSSETSELRPLHTVENVHQSGVNCLHVSDIKDIRGCGSGFLFYVISGGDDQALHSLRFDIALRTDMHGCTESEASNSSIYHRPKQNYSIKLSCHEKVISAHSSAVKGVWTDGSWVFSTGLDQRVRCWYLEENGKLTEHGHLVISVPEPETLDARACSRNKHYQIAVAGRGMQMVEFVAPGQSDNVS